MSKAFKCFEDLDIWKRGCRLAVDIYKITDTDKISKDWGLRDQLRRSAVSIPSNIAEGFDRDSDAEFKRFLFIAKGSCAELKTQIYIAQAILFIEEETSSKIIQECEELSKMIGSLIKYLKSSTK